MLKQLFLHLQDNDPFQPTTQRNSIGDGLIGHGKRKRDITAPPQQAAKKAATIQAANPPTPNNVKFVNKGIVKKVLLFEKHETKIAY